MMNVQPRLVSASPSVDLLFGRDDRDGRGVMVWWGLSVVERLSGDRNRVEWKLSAARFYNMGVKVAVLVEAYGFARTTLKRFGDALRSGDPERISRAFAGQGGPRRVTPEIEGYIRGRYASLRWSVRDYNRRIREEVLDRWKVSLSPERLRWIFRSEDRVRGWGRCRARPASGANGRDSSANSSCTDDLSRNSSLARAVMPFSGRAVPNGVRFCHHAGLVLLFPWLDLVLSGWPSSPSLVRQLFVQVLCGAVNHEQGKELHMPSLRLLSGPMLQSPGYLRRLTDALATPENTAEVFRRNLGLLGEPFSRVFLFDPHAERYTGKLPLLRTWIGSIHVVDKALLLDFIHTVDGRPCFVKHYDNFYDVRDRFRLNRQAFAELLGPDQAAGLTWVADRAVYGRQALGDVLDDGYAIVTWEKNYAGDAWLEDEPFRTHLLTRPRNRSDDLQTLRLDWQEGIWAKDPRFHRFIVRTSRLDRPELEAAVLAGGPFPSNLDAVVRMFSRWSQESNLGYLLRHMGIGELTARAWQPYAEIADKLDDRQVESPGHKQLVGDKQQIERELGRKLVSRRRARRANAPSLARLEEEQRRLSRKRDALLERYELLKRDGAELQDAEVDELLSAVSALKEDRRQLRKRARKAARLADLDKEIDALTIRLERLEAELKNTPVTESRLALLIAAGTARMDTTRKAFFDAIRITCCNIFLAAMDRFRDLYDNRRDDHVLLRALTRAAGFIFVRNGVIHIRLIPELTVQPKARAALSAFCDRATALINSTWRGRASPVLITLTDSSPRHLSRPRGP